ncbi:MAG: hypothetical protein AAFY99_07485 [Pseudomonadota bacterium]
MVAVSLAMGAVAAASLLLPDQLANFALFPESSLLNSLLAIVGALIFIVGVQFISRKPRAEPVADIGARESLRMATRAIEDARADRVSKTKSEADPDSRQKVGLSEDAQPSHFGQAPMRRENKTIPDVVNGSATDRQEPSNKPADEIGSTAFEPELYFDPFVDLESGRVSYYQVCRKRITPPRQRPSYIRHLVSKDSEASAVFDRSLIEQTIAASRQVFASLGDECYLMVPCGHDLLENDQHWTALEQLFAAQASLIRGLIFLADSKTLGRADNKAFGRLAKLHQQGGAIACHGLHLNLETADIEFLSDLEGVVVGLEEAFRAASTPDLADPAAISAFEFFQREKMMFLMNNITTEGDAADAIDLFAQYGAGPFFGGPRSLLQQI